MMTATDQNPNGRGLSKTSLAFLALREKALKIWEREVRAHVHGARDLPDPVLLNTIRAFYDNIAEALTPSYARQSATSGNNAATAHGGERAHDIIWR